jgi:hypothetical protein
MNRDHPWQVVKIHDSDGTQVAVSTHRSFRTAETVAFLRDAVVVLTRLTGARVAHCYDVRRTPRPEPAPATERWGGPPATPEETR